MFFRFYTPNTLILGSVERPYNRTIMAEIHWLKYSNRKSAHIV